MIKMGQAKLSTTTRGTFFLTYKSFGSDLVGERSDAGGCRVLPRSLD